VQPESRVAGSDDIDAVTDTMVTAFFHDPVWGPYSFPDAARRREQSRPMWRLFIRDAVRFPWVWVTPECEAAAVWIPPGETEMTPAGEGEVESALHDALGPAQAGVVLDAFQRLDDNHPQDEPHHYLSLLGTHQAHRGRGLGMGLLRACLAVIDAEHSPAYLESTNPANNARYMTCGFQPRSTVSLPNGHQITTMWRRAR
jgi:GNAT superfamily N-acetyltransferase